MLRLTSVHLLQEPELHARLRQITREARPLHAAGERFSGPAGHGPGDFARRLRAEARAGGTRLAELRLHLDEPLARRVARLDGELVEKRLLLAAEQARLRCLAAFEGIAQVRWREGVGHDKAVVHLLLSRREHGEPARPLRRADVDRLEAVWREESYRAFGLRLRERLLERGSPVHEQAEGLRRRWLEASREAQRVLHERIWGRAPQEDLARALHVASNAENAWRAAHEALDGASSAGAARSRLEVVQVRLERGREAFAALPAAQREVALSRALDHVGLANVRGVLYPTGPASRDLGLSLYYERGSVDQAALRRAVEDRLGPELARQGCRLSEGEVRAVVATPDPTAPVQALQASDPSRKGERSGTQDWARERVYSRNFHLPAEALAGLSQADQRAVIQEAIGRNWPELEAKGLARSFVVRPLEDDSRILRVTIVVPEREMDAFRAIGRPGGPTELAAEVGRVVAERITGAAVAASSAPMHAGQGFGPVRLLSGVSMARQAAESPIRAAATTALEALSRAMPAPLRSAHVLARHVGGILRREEE